MGLFKHLLGLPSTKPLRCQCLCRHELRYHLFAQHHRIGIKYMVYDGHDPFVDLGKLQSCNCCIRHMKNKPSIHLDDMNLDIIPYSETNPPNRKSERLHKSWYSETSSGKKTRLTTRKDEKERVSNPRTKQRTKKSGKRVF